MTKPIMEAVRANMKSSLSRMDNLKRNDPDLKKADMIEPLLNRVLAILDGKEPVPEPEKFVCKFAEDESEPIAGTWTPAVIQHAEALSPRPPDDDGIPF
jgi:hypothetical protein